jgi:hypothetical protein
MEFRRDYQAGALAGLLQVDLLADIPADFLADTPVDFWVDPLGLLVEFWVDLLDLLADFLVDPLDLPHHPLHLHHRHLFIFRYQMTAQSSENLMYLLDVIPLSYHPLYPNVSCGFMGSRQNSAQIAKKSFLPPPISETPPVPGGCHYWLKCP